MVPVVWKPQQLAIQYEDQHELPVAHTQFICDRAYSQKGINPTQGEDQ